MSPTTRKIIDAFSGAQIFALAILLNLVVWGGIILAVALVATNVVRIVDSISENAERRAYVAGMAKE